MSVITFMIMQVPTPIPNFDTYKAKLFSYEFLYMSWRFNPTQNA